MILKKNDVKIKVRYRVLYELAIIFAVLSILLLILTYFGGIVFAVIITIFLFPLTIPSLLEYRESFASIIHFKNHSIKINKSEFKYSAFDEVQINKDNELILYTEAMINVFKISLKLFKKEQIEQIIKEFEHHNKIVKCSSECEVMKFHTQNTKNIIYFLIAMVLIVAGITNVMIEENNLFLWILLLLFLGLMAKALKLLYKGDVYFESNNIYFVINNSFSYKCIMFSSISKAIIENDNNLVFYDNTNDTYYSFDMDNLRKADRQFFINTLSKRVLLTIDVRIAEEEHYILPDDAVKEVSQITNRRRKVTEIAEMQPIKEANKIIKPQRNVELDTQSATNDNKGNRRRLEL